MNQDYTLFFVIGLMLCVIAIPSIIILVVHKADLNKTKDMIYKFPTDVQHKLQNAVYRQEVVGKRRWQQAFKSLGYGLLIYVVILLASIFKLFSEGICVDWKTFLIATSIIFVFIVVFILRDFLRVAPWRKVCEISAIIYNTTPYNKGQYNVIYYDYIKGDYAVDTLAGSAVKKSKMGPNGTSLRVLVVERANSIKVIGVS